jgi:hypothetical protein
MASPASLLLFAFLALFALLSPALACKCFDHSGGGHDVRVTQACCKEAMGKMVNGVDCNAHSMSNRLAAFAQCCARKTKKSDCHCSISCGSVEDSVGDSRLARMLN